MQDAKLWFINVHTYPNPKPTPYSNANTVTMSCSRFWLERIQLRPETNDKLTFLPIRLCFDNVYTPTPTLPLQ